MPLKSQLTGIQDSSKEGTETLLLDVWHMCSGIFSLHMLHIAASPLPVILDPHASRHSSMPLSYDPLQVSKDS